MVLVHTMGATNSRGEIVGEDIRKEILGQIKLSTDPIDNDLIIEYNPHQKIFDQIIGHKRCIKKENKILDSNERKYAKSKSTDLTTIIDFPRIKINNLIYKLRYDDTHYDSNFHIDEQIYVTDGPYQGQLIDYHYFNNRKLEYGLFWAYMIETLDDNLRYIHYLGNLCPINPTFQKKPNELHKDDITKELMTEIEKTSVDVRKSILNLLKTINSKTNPN
jgi:hypothetical protein